MTNIVRVPPDWKKFEVGQNEYGTKTVKGVRCFVIMTPENWMLYQFVHRRLKDTCMAFEKAYDMDWEDAVEKGFTVLKLFGTAVDKTEASLQHIDDWVEIIGENEEVAA